MGSKGVCVLTEKFFMNKLFWFAMTWFPIAIWLTNGLTQRFHLFIFFADVDSPLIRCSNGSYHLGRWFHAACMGLEEDSMPKVGEDWCCSEECKDTGSSCLCKCRKVRDGPFVSCVRGEDCINGYKLHLACVDLPTEPGITLTLV